MGPLPSAYDHALGGVGGSIGGSCLSRARITAASLEEDGPSETSSATVGPTCSVGCSPSRRGSWRCLCEIQSKSSQPGTHSPRWPRDESHGDRHRQPRKDH
jgi:hypothetical protein